MESLPDGVLSAAAHLFSTWLPWITCGLSSPRDHLMSVLRFLDFELDVFRRQLTFAGTPVKIGSRSLEILIVLASRPGEVVSREEILDAVWPNNVTAENSLRVNIVSLRKALSIGAPDSLVQSVAGRGYILSAAARKEELEPPPIQLVEKSRGNLPELHTSIIGREDFIRRCLDSKQARVLSVVGPGGIGKTTVAVEFANKVRSKYEAAYFVDLAALKTAASIGPTLASLLGLSVYGNDPLPGIIAAIGHNKYLFVFDNCEHVIDQTADLIENISRACPAVFIVTTSREPLGIPSEMIRRLGPLETPGDGASPSDTLSYSAVTLFMERLEHSIEMGSVVRDEDLSRVAAIVRRLDGIPLAIEFAAARVIDLGFERLLTSLSQPLTVLRRGRRTAPPRQQTLQATLDWSYGFLTPNEQVVLQALSVFAQSFTRDGASTICGSLLGKDDLEDAIWGLQLKSLLAKSESGAALRLLETTREYAAIKLVAGGRHLEVRAAHAHFVRERLRDAELHWDKLDTFHWMSGYGKLIHDLRSALAFCEETANTRLMLELVAGSGVLWTQLGLMNEQFRYIEKAIHILDSSQTNDAAIETQLRSAYGAIAYNVHSGAGDNEGLRQFELAARSARDLDDSTMILRARSGVCAILTTQGLYTEANDVAAALRLEVGPDADSAVTRIFAHNSHYLGRHDDAFRFARQSLEANGVNIRGTLTSGANFGQKTLSLMIMAKTAYLRGEIKNSLELLEELTSGAIKVDHAISVCLALSVGACPIYFGLGDYERGRYFLEILRDISTRNSLDRWREWADGFDYALGRPKAASSDVIASLMTGGNGPRLENTIMIGGKQIEISLLDLALKGQAGWCEPELLRLKGEGLLDRGDAEGRGLVLRGFDLAAEQSATTWQLRCANGLANYSTSGTADSDLSRIERVLRLFPDDAPANDLAIAEARLKGVRSQIEVEA